MEKNAPTPDPQRPPLERSPLDAYRQLTESPRLLGAVRASLAEIEDGYLAEPVALAGPWVLRASDGSLQWGGAPRAGRDGYGLSPGSAPGPDGTYRVEGALVLGGPADPELEGRESFEAPGGREDADAPGGLRAPERSRPGDVSIVRVEAGALLPGGVDRVLPVEEAHIVGSGRIRPLRPAREGEGVVDPRHWREGATGGFAPGTRLTPRLRALLRAAGVTEVSVAERLSVGLAVVGSDVEALDAPAVHAAAPRSVDLSTSWMEAALGGLGARVLPGGVLPDAFEPLRDLILHWRERVRAIILVGGLGRGVTDRTHELLDRFDAQIYWADVSMEGVGLLRARALDLDIFAVSGLPLQAAAAWDLFLRPHLLARSRARPPEGPWPATSWPAAPSSLRMRRRGDAWQVLPGALVEGAGGEPVVRFWSPQTPFWPCLPGQSGWAILPPEGEPGGIRYVPLGA